MLDLLSDAPRAELNLWFYRTLVKTFNYLALTLIEGYEEHVQVFKITILLL